MMFMLNEVEERTFQEWKEKHDVMCPYVIGKKSIGSIGGRLTYRFTPTGLGTLVSVKCACGRHKDLTDMENNW